MRIDGLDGKVISLAGFQNTMRFPIIGDLYAYWDGLRAGRPVPLRSEIDPRGIEQALEYAFVLERIAPQVSRFRLTGVHMTDMMGMEVRGMPVTALFSAPDRVRAGDLMERVFQTPEIAELTLKAETGAGRPPVEAQMIVLPLRSDLGDVSRALGCFVSQGQIGRTPRRFDLASVQMTPLTGRPAGGRTIRAASLQGMAEAGARYAARSSGDRPRGHLKLVKTEE